VSIRDFTLCLSSLFHLLSTFYSCIQTCQGARLALEMKRLKFSPRNPNKALTRVRYCEFVISEAHWATSLAVQLGRYMGSHGPLVCNSAHITRSVSVVSFMALFSRLPCHMK
jgi:hypothetical protein